MVKIRLRPKGKKGQRSYQLVAIDERKARDSGKYLAYLGYYDPYKKESNMAQFKEKIDGWINKGAQPTKTVKSLLKKFI